MRTFPTVRGGLAVLLVSVSVASLTLGLACDKPASPAGDADAAASASASAAPAAAASSTASDADAGARGVPTGKTIYPPPDCPAGGKDGCAKVKAVRAGMEGVKILRHFDGPGGPKSILLLQATTAGNACNGGPLFFVRVANNAAPQYSDVFDYCGGPDPMVGAMPDKILINVPAHPPNRGGAIIPAKNMEYDIATGTLVAAAPDTKKRKR